MKALPDPQIQRAIEGYFRGLGADTPDEWLTLFADEAVSHDPVGTPPAEGPREIQRQWEALKSQFSNLTVSPKRVFYAGTGAATQWQAEGTGTNGRKVRFEGIHIIELAVDGSILTVVAYWDPAAMMIELAG